MIRTILAALMLCALAIPVEARPAPRPSVHSVKQVRLHWGHHHRVSVRGRHGNLHARGSVSLAGVVGPLVAKALEIQSACGSIVVSAVAGRSNRSNHPRGRAVDLQGNPGCIYAHLQGWPGGYSTDYATAPGGKHVHISYNPGGQEWGIRFTHRHGKTRYAAHRNRVAHAL
jgi:hypothetical protein